VDSTEATDRNYVSIGCSTLFINFLRYELKYGLDAIVGAAAPTLANVYQNLTGNTDAWVRFTALVDRLFPTGVPSGLTTDNPWPAERQAGCLVQGLFGRQGNFEVVQPAGGGGLVHFWRNNEDPAMPWSAPTPFGMGLGAVSGASLIQSNYGKPGNLEVVAVAAGELQHLWRDSGPAFAWSGPILAGAGVTGNPALIQSRFGVQGNFEVVAPAGGGGLVHFWRNNDNPAMPWSAPTPFATGLGNVDAVTMIESNYTRPGNLEVVARVGGELYFTWRDDTGWHDPIQLELGVAGRPALIQGRFGTVGNFELVVPTAGGGLVHFWRNNDDPAMPWSAPTPFGTGAYDDISLIQSNYGDPGNLEVIAREGDKLDFYWRDSGPSFTWNGPYTIESGF
jgi:hypothetical protein